MVLQLTEQLRINLQLQQLEKIIQAATSATLYYFTNTSANRGGTINVAEAAGNFYLLVQKTEF